MPEHFEPEYNDPSKSRWFKFLLYTNIGVYPIVSLTTLVVFVLNNDRSIMDIFIMVMLYVVWTAAVSLPLLVLVEGIRNLFSKKTNRAPQIKVNYVIALFLSNIIYTYWNFSLLQ